MGNAGASLEEHSTLLKIERQGAVLTVGLKRPAKRRIRAFLDHKTAKVKPA